MQFLSEVNSEIKKTVWPRREEFIGTALVVCFVIAVFAVILGGMDSAFNIILQRFFFA